jgi:hypothetical protein
MEERTYTNQEILRCHGALAPISGQQEIPISLKAKISRLWRVLRPEGEKLYELRSELWERDGLRDEDGKLVKEVDGGVAKQIFKDKAAENICNREWRELMESECTLTFEPLQLAELEAAESAMVRRSDVRLALDADQLGWLIQCGMVIES